MHASRSPLTSPQPASGPISGPLARLEELRDYGGVRRTVGLSDAVLARLLPEMPQLAAVIERAYARHLGLRAELPELAGDEDALCALLQEGVVNFYTAPTVNPYVPLAAQGSFVVTSHGAVVHDNGGYGMLGLGHAPEPVLAALAQPWVMANVMTPSLSQKRLTDRLHREIGHRRADPCPFARFLFMNSGSEAVTVASRISDINARLMTGPGGRHEGRVCKFLTLQGSFHGRTDRPAQVSHSTRPKYEAHLASFRGLDNLVVVPPNDIAALEAAFAAADRDGVFLESMFVEPVMGEGRPGMAMTRAFYDRARALTAAHGALLVVDSIQAGLRAHGVLSVVDYPGFEDCVGPDLETYSKALNAGQTPLSVLAANQRAVDLYVKGVYGNTMTGNPRALEVGCVVLDAMTPALRANIVLRGQQFLERLRALSDELPGMITLVQGTGLLFCAELDGARYQVVGFGGIEEACRHAGLGVIHGGKNALRFTPWFGITSTEVDLVIDTLREVLRRFWQPPT